MRWSPNEREQGSAARRCPIGPMAALGTQIDLGAPSARWAPRVGASNGVVTPWHPWAVDLPPRPVCPRAPRGEGAGVPCSTTVLAARTLAGPSAVEGRAAVGG